MNSIKIPCRPGEVSDGYHTFDELYEHRHALFLALASVLCQDSWISPHHNDGTGMAGWFVAGINLRGVGPVTYHLPERLWNDAQETGCRVLDRAPEWDGHTSLDVLQRLKKWSAR